MSIFVGALAYWATNDVNNTAQFFSASQVQYAASSITDVAVQSIRYFPEPTTPTAGVNTSSTPSNTPVTAPGYSSPGYCWTPPTTEPAGAASGTSSLAIGTSNPITLTAWCSTVENLSQSTGSNSTRVVTIYVCQASQSASQCASTPLHTAVISFDDYPLGGGLSLKEQCNVEGVSCGEGSTIVSWVKGSGSS